MTLSPHDVATQKNPLESAITCYLWMGLTLRWAKFQVSSDPTYISNNTLAYSCDDTIIFIDINTGEQKFYRASGEDFGDGISCIAGHKFYKFFAFAELAFKPRIFILSYPLFVTLQVISNDDAYGKYIQLKFSHMEQLIALSGYPYYKLRIWNYRLGQLIVEKMTGITAEIQRLQISSFHPFLISQYSPELGKIIIWEQHASGQRAFLLRRPVQVPDINRDNVLSLIFGIDGFSYFTNKYGNLFSLAPSTGVIKPLWEWNAPCKIKSTLGVYKGGFVISGYKNEIKYVKKIEGNYTEIWSVTTEFEIIFLSRNSQELLHIVDSESNLFCIEEVGELRTFKRIGDENKNVKFFDLLYPEGNYVIILSYYDELLLVEIETGKKVSTALHLQNNVTSMISHRDQPIVIIGDSKCVLKFISFHNRRTPTLLTEFFIGGSPIKSLQLSSSRNFLIVCDDNFEFYVMKGLRTKIECITHFHCEYFVLDYNVYETQDIIGIVVIISKDINNKQIITKDCLIVNIQKKGLKIKKHITRLPNHYISVAPLFTTSGTTIQFFAVLFNERRFHVLEIKEFTVKVVNTLKTVHQLKSFKLYTDLNNIVSFGLDGTVCVFDSDSKHLDINYFGCNRFGETCMKACSSPNRRYCLCLTKAGSLKCVEVEPFNNAKVTLTVSKEEQYKLEGYKASQEHPDKSWLIVEIENKIFDESNQFKTIKMKLLGDLELIKKKVKDLLNKNEAAEELDTLKTKQFNLNIEWENNVKELARKERDKENVLLQSYIEDQERITKWIINNTWDLMEVKTRAIHGIFSSIACENFGLVLGKEYNKKIDLIQLLRITERSSGPNDTLLPWIPKWTTYYTLSDLKPKYSEEEQSKLIKHISDTDTTDQLINLDAFQLIHALSGTNTHDFIESDTYKYEQFEVVTFLQMYIQELLCQRDILKLKEFFNKDFEDLVKMKEDQVKYVKERNDRLRYIQKELVILANLKGILDVEEPEPIDDPSFCQDEMPESIIKVEDHEIQAKPYISPSREKILKALAYQEEQRRLALLADDFRERALMAMMDGVLERRWEDEIKKEPPLPDCKKNNKDPYDYTKEDVKAVQEWEEKLKFLQGEREKYNTMLHEERIKTQNYQDEQIMRFNMKCGEKYLQKVQVDAAIRQEELKILRTAFFNYDRMVFKQMEKDLIAQSENNKQLHDELVYTIHELDKLQQECRLRYDQLQTRDRMLDKQFKSQFGETAPGFMVDQAYKLFKKRPKWPQRAWATAAILTDMANRIALRNSSRQGLSLPEECYEYLALVDSIENHNLAPNTIDRHMWNVICRMRRLKMESEFRVRACGVQLAEAEASFNVFSRELQTKKNDFGNLDRNLQDLKQKYKEHLQNRYVQLVLPMGLVEVPLTGSICDFEGCVLLCSSDVGDINEIIKRAGRKKLAALHRFALFRRRIIFKEWTHKVYQLTLDDMIRFLNSIERVKVTLEMLNWLRLKKMGKTEDLSNTALTREIDVKLNHLQGQLADMDLKIEDAMKKVEDQKRVNSGLDKKIQNINVDVTKLNLQRDVFLEEKELRERKDRMEVILERGRLVRQIQTNHANILELVTVLELQRLRTYPTLAQPTSICP